jgi:membrane-bound lytic murein transglycosylase D
MGFMGIFMQFIDGQQGLRSTLIFTAIISISLALGGCSSNQTKTVSFDDDEEDILLDHLTHTEAKNKSNKQTKTSLQPSTPKHPSSIPVSYSSPSNYSNSFAGNSLWQEVHRGFRLRNYTNHPRVAQVIREYRGKSRTLQTHLNQSQPFMHMIVTEAKRRNLPMEVVLVAFVESGFKATAVSRSGASGLWQFMPATGQIYGLPRTHEFDARLDPFAATGAAFNYLQKLNRQFRGDWLLTFAAYNGGEGRVGRAVSKARAQGKPINFWNLDLPAETMRYVPKILAFKEVLLKPQQFGVHLPNIANTPYLTQVRINQPVNLRLVASQAGLPSNTLTKLNPYFLQGVAKPHLSRRVIVPKQHANRITQAMRATPQTFANHHRAYTRRVSYHANRDISNKHDDELL